MRDKDTSAVTQNNECTANDRENNETETRTESRSESDLVREEMNVLIQKVTMMSEEVISGQSLPSQVTGMAAPFTSKL